MAGPLTEETRQEALRIAADHLANTLGDLSALLPLGSYGRTRIIWSGYAYNAGSLLTLAALAYSLGWIPAAARVARARRRTRAIAEGRCPNCGYSIAGLSAPTCPECGGPTDGPVTQERRPGR